MAKSFNQLLYDDIVMLKSIDKKKFPKEYRQVFQNIMKRYNISKSTVYVELNKEVPGKYKKHDTKSRHIFISNKEIGMVKEMLEADKSLRHICKIMSLELGFRYTHYRIYKVKELILSGLPTGKMDTMLEVSDSEASADLLSPDKGMQIKPKDDAVEFKGNISRFFYRLSMLALIDPKTPVKIKIGAEIYPSSTRVIKDCFEHIIYSANSSGKSSAELFRFDMETILIKQLSSVKRGSPLTPAALRQLESIRKSLLATDPENNNPGSLSGGYDLDDIYRAVSHFSPSTTRAHVAQFMGA